MAKSFDIVTSLAVSREVVYIVTSFEEEEARISPSRLYQYNNGSWDYNEYGWMIASMALYRAPGATQRALCIMSREGSVLFPHDESIQETIVNANAPAAKGKRLGFINNIIQIGDHLYACGEGGQTYRRSDDGVWSILDPTLLDDQGDLDRPQRMLMPDGQPFNGRFEILADYPELAREYARLVIAADPNTLVRSLAGDTEQRIFAAAGNGRVLLWEGSAFRDIPTNSDKPLIGVLIKDEHVLVCGRNGALLHGNEHSGFKQLPFANSYQNFTTMAYYNGLYYLASNGMIKGLFATDLKRLEEVDTGLEPEISSASRVMAVDGVLWVVGHRDIVRFDGKTWTRIGMPPLTRPRRARKNG